MRWWTFFNGNFAIHGTSQINRLGQPASAGCVGSLTESAQTLYELILEHGRANTVIDVVD